MQRKWATLDQSSGIARGVVWQRVASHDLARSILLQLSAPNRAVIRRALMCATICPEYFQAFWIIARRTVCTSCCPKLADRIKKEVDRVMD